jgi:hypothetical protein
MRRKRSAAGWADLAKDRAGLRPFRRGTPGPKIASRFGRQFRVYPSPTRSGSSPVEARAIAGGGRERPWTWEKDFPSRDIFWGLPQADRPQQEPRQRVREKPELASPGPLISVTDAAPRAAARWCFSSSAPFRMRRSFRSVVTRGFVGTPAGRPVIGRGKQPRRRRSGGPPTSPPPP